MLVYEYNGNAFVEKEVACYDDKEGQLKFVDGVERVSVTRPLPDGEPFTAYFATVDDPDAYASLSFELEMAYQEACFDVVFG